MTTLSSSTQTAPAAAPSGTHKRPDIQGLRAVAVLAVIANHLFEWPAGAFVGVDVFFVISGFLITSLLLREYEDTDRISFLGFYRRRVKRIVPAATLVLLVTCCASFVLLSWDRFVTTVGDAVAAFFFVSNWRFKAEGADYFAEGLPPSPLQHYWSLSIEEQFYFVWPWLLLGLMLLGVRRLGWGHHHLRAVAGTTIAVATASSFAWAMLQTGTDPAGAYFSTLTRVWELGIGALVAVVAPWCAIRHPAARTVLAWAGLGGIVVSLFVVSESAGFPAPWAALPVVATALVIVAGVGGEQRHLWPLVSRQGTYVGDLSYSLYLWHFPVIVLLAAVVETQTATYYGLAVVLIAGLSAASYHGFEDPARRLDWIERHGRRIYWAEGWKYVLVGVSVIVAGTLAAYTLMPGRIAAAPSTVPLSAFEGGQSLDEQRAEEIRCVGAAAMEPSHHCPLNEGPGLTPSPGNLDVSLGAFNCWLTVDDPFKVCHFGSTEPDATKIALVGDSHTVLLALALRDWALAENWSVDSFGGENCQWQAAGAGTQTCVAQPKIQARLETGMYDAVITTTARDRYAVDMPIEPAVASYLELWEPVRATGTRIIVVADVPLPSEESLLCVQRVGFSPDTDKCGTPEAEAYAKADLPVLTAAELPGTEVIDMHDYFCSDGFCPSVIGNVIVYRDQAGHMTEPYAATLGQFLAPEVKRALRG